MDDRWNGWVGFAALMAMIMGMIDVIMGLVAVIRGEYYVIHGSQLIIFDTTTWGWISILLGVALVLIGMSLANGAGWARWVTIIAVAANLLTNLGWLGNSAYPLWSLTLVALQVIVLFALTARWKQAQPQLG
jgi:hypothetical protein